MVQFTIQQTFDLALRHHRAGRLQEAENFYRQILADQPRHADAAHFLGVIAHQTGRNDVAVDLIRRAIALKPNWPEAHNNLGNVLKGNGQLNEAIAAYRQAIAQRPKFADAHYNLGNALNDQGKLDEAIAAYRRAIALNPELPQAHNNLGNALKGKGEFEQAIGAYRAAIALRPNDVSSHFNLGIALHDNGQLDQAIAAYQRAISLDPGNADVHYNLGKALTDDGQLDEAIGAYRRAITLNPNLPEPHNNLGYLLLGKGDFQEGWQEIEWRWKCNLRDAPERDFAQPQWDGCPLEARTILIQTEQGFGDSLQFIRYIHLVGQRGGKIIIECQAQLQRLLQLMAGPGQGPCQVIARGDPLPAFDFHCPMLNLPQIFGTTLANIPKAIPYLRPNAQDAESWRRRLSEQSSMVKVGLVWAGNPTHPNDRNRSMTLARLTQLAQVPGVRFFSLQKGKPADQAKSPPAGMELVDWTSDLKDFADTAALIANLDLVIAVDTAVVHLAGAMGKPVWTLLPFVPDYRWMLEQDSSPWYPTMRLFRQSARGDWDSVVTRVVDALSVWIKNRG